jgi:pSer/pThr/pTyr-binding forkhead associated (FHA) protein/S1-C subfamily serine protease
MKRIEFEILSGGRAGRRAAFDKSFIAVGRDPLSDLRFDAEADLDVSTKHAVVMRAGDAFVIRDLGSRNGTFVNGRRIEADTSLGHGDVVRCGAHGPEARVHLLTEGGEVVMPKVSAPERPSAPPAQPAPTAGDLAPKPAPPAPRPAPPSGPSATSVLRAEVKAGTQRLRAVLLTLGIIAVGALAIVIWQGRTAQQRTAQLGSAIDSLGREIAALQKAKVTADSEAARLQREIRSAANDPARLSALQVQYTTVQRRQRDIATAQGVDYASIQRANAAAVAVIAVRFPDSTMWEGTAFSVTAQGLMVTNRHLVVTNAGDQAREIAVRFSGSVDVLPARVVRVAPDADLAILQVESAGPFPTIAGFATGPVEPGAAIALLGFPGGCGGCARPIAKLVSGSVTGASDSVLEMDAFSGTGASGSPIFDRNGLAIGVLFGGRGGSSSTEIVGLPAHRARALLGVK